MIDIFEKQKIRTSMNVRCAKGSIFSENFYYAYSILIEPNNLNITLFDSEPLYNIDGEIVKVYNKKGELIQGIIEGTYSYDFRNDKEEIKLNGEKRDCIKLSLDKLKEKYLNANYRE